MLRQFSGTGPSQLRVHSGVLAEVEQRSSLGAEMGWGWGALVGGLCRCPRASSPAMAGCQLTSRRTWKMTEYLRRTYAGNTSEPFYCTWGRDSSSHPARVPGGKL